MVHGHSPGKVALAPRGRSSLAVPSLPQTGWAPAPERVQPGGRCRGWKGRRQALLRQVAVRRKRARRTARKCRSGRVPGSGSRLLPRDGDRPARGGRMARESFGRNALRCGQRVSVLDQFGLSHRSEAGRGLDPATMIVAPHAGLRKPCPGPGVSRWYGAAPHRERARTPRRAQCRADGVPTSGRFTCRYSSQSWRHVRRARGRFRVPWSASSRPLTSAANGCRQQPRQPSGQGESRRPW